MGKLTALNGFSIKSLSKKAQEENKDAVVLQSDSDFLKIREKLCHSVDFFSFRKIQLGQPARVASRRRPKCSIVLREVSPAAAIVK